MRRAARSGNNCLFSFFLVSVTPPLLYDDAILCANESKSLVQSKIDAEAVRKNANETTIARQCGAMIEKILKNICRGT